MVSSRLIALFVLIGTSTATAAEIAPSQRKALFDGFAAGWRTSWVERRLFARPTNYTVITDQGRPVLHAESVQANSALLRRLPAHLPPQGSLSWRWKVRAPVGNGADERTRAGDDYAARVFIVFEPSWLPLRTRAINYVWAASEPVGSVFASPYTHNVGMIVLRSGSAEAGFWRDERRDIAADYRQFFGESPTEITAVAVLVDTDNTSGRAEAWFSDLVLEINSPAAASKL